MDGWEQIAFCLGLFVTLLALYTWPESRSQRQRRYQAVEIKSVDWRDDVPGRQGHV